MATNVMGLRIYYDAITGEGKTRFAIDFDDIAKYIPIGVERFDISGDTRKTVQHTRGIDNQNGQITDNIYVDTWGTSPDKVTLAGVVKMPEGINQPVIGTIENNSGVVGTRKYSFIGIMEQIYNWNSMPAYSARGDKMYLYDLITNQILQITMKRRRYPMSVDRPMLVPFELEFVAIGRVVDGKETIEIPAPWPTSIYA